MRTIKVIKFGVEHDVVIQSHTEIADNVRGSYEGYSLICNGVDNAINIYIKSNHYFERFKTKIGKLFFDINTDTVFYSQYGFPEIEDSIGVYKEVIKHLRADDVLILKGRTNSRVEYRKKMSTIQQELNNFMSDSKFIYIPRKFLRKWK